MVISQGGLAAIWKMPGASEFAAGAGAGLGAAAFFSGSGSGAGAGFGVGSAFLVAGLGCDGCWANCNEACHEGGKEEKK